MTKPTLNLTTNYTTLPASGIRGSVGHRPMLGDNSSDKYYINNILVLVGVNGKSINKYSGKYVSTTRYENNIQSVLEENFPNLTKDYSSLADELWQKFVNHKSIKNIRKTKFVTGCVFSNKK